VPICNKLLNSITLYCPPSFSFLFNYSLILFISIPCTYIYPLLKTEDFFVSSTIFNIIGIAIKATIASISMTPIILLGKISLLFS